MAGIETVAVDVYVEASSKRTFVGATDWPGWCRSGRDEAAAVEALLDHAERYRTILEAAGIGFPSRVGALDLRVVERLPGTPTTEFGAPDAVPAADERPISEADLQGLRAILEACWATLDRARDSAPATLRKGPRGGGRDLQVIYDHVMEAEAAYFSRLGRRLPVKSPWTPATVELERAAVLDGLEAAAHGQLEPAGPRGGRRWLPRYFVRRTAWHTVDHAWEIEDRSDVEAS